MKFNWLWRTPRGAANDYSDAKPSSGICSKLITGNSSLPLIFTCCCLIKYQWITILLFRCLNLSLKELFLIISLSALTPNKFRMPGSQRKIWSIFSSGQKFRTQDGWVGSANATSVLCHTYKCWKLSFLNSFKSACVLGSKF